jgi:hypothetical protein
MGVYNCPNENQMIETYREYLDCFRRRDFEKIKEYISDNLYFYWGVTMPPLAGRDRFIDFFKAGSEFFDEDPQASNIKAEIPILRAWIRNTLTIKKDWPAEENPFAIEMKKGEAITVEGYVNYCFNEEGKIAVILDCDYGH